MGLGGHGGGDDPEEEEIVYYGELHKVQFVLDQPVVDVLNREDGPWEDGTHLLGKVGEDPDPPVLRAHFSRQYPKFGRLLDMVDEVLVGITLGKCPGEEIAPPETADLRPVEHEHFSREDLFLFFDFFFSLP